MSTFSIIHGNYGQILHLLVEFESNLKSEHHGFYGLNWNNIFNFFGLIGNLRKKTELENIHNTRFGRLFEKIGFTKRTLVIGLKNDFE